MFGQITPRKHLDVDGRVQMQGYQDVAARAREFESIQPRQFFEYGYRRMFSGIGYERPPSVPTTGHNHAAAAGEGFSGIPFFLKPPNG